VAISGAIPYRTVLGDRPDAVTPVGVANPSLVFRMSIPPLMTSSPYRVPLTLFPLRTGRRKRPVLEPVSDPPPNTDKRRSLERCDSGRRH
jgi:hypothetical protein